MSCTFRRFRKGFSKLVEMFECGRCEVDLFAARVFGVAKREPALFPHRRDAGVKSSGRAKLDLGHHVPNRKAIASLRRTRNEFQDLLFERIERRQRGQAAQSFGELQESKIDVSRTCHDLHTVQGGVRSANLRLANAVN